jgi:hypothetical protein
MKTILELELIGDDRYERLRAHRNGQARHDLPLRREIELMRLASPRLRPWVARIARDPATGHLIRDFLPVETKDYSRANSIGSRGIYGYWVLGDGVYEVNERLNWDKARRYYLRVAGGVKTEMTRQEVYRCLDGR